MNLAGILASVYLVPFVVGILILNNGYKPLSSILSGHIQFSSSSLLMYSLFNTIVFSTIIVSYKRYTKEVDQDLTCPYSDVFSIIIVSDKSYNKEVDQDLPCLYYSHGVREYALDYINGSSDEESDYEESHGSDGYEDDDVDVEVDNSGGDDDVGWEDDEGYDDNLRVRAEDFIAKVINGWKEEKMRDKSTLLN